MKRSNLNQGTHLTRRHKKPQWGKSHKAEGNKDQSTQNSIGVGYATNPDQRIEGLNTPLQSYELSYHLTHHGKRIQQILHDITK